MGSITQAVIQHKLSPKEIILLAETLNDIKFLDKNGNKLDWASPSANTNFLEKYWEKTPEDFMKIPWGIEDLALLENEKLSLHFNQRYIVSFDSNLKSGIYKSNPVAKSEFDLLAKSIALQLKAIDIIIIEDWYYDHAFAADDCPTVEMIRQKLKTTNLPFYEIDLNS